MPDLIIAGTGHRPDKLGGYEKHVQQAVESHAVKQLIALKPVSVISGMALGWDQALAAAAVKLGIPLFAYIPFQGQESRWPASSQANFHWLLSKAEEIVCCSPGEYSVQAMQVRNERMVDDCDTVLALWNGSNGGTANCVRYAKAKEVPIINCWEEWKNARG